MYDPTDVLKADKLKFDEKGSALCSQFNVHCIARDMSMRSINRAKFNIVNVTRYLPLEAPALCE